MVGQSNTNELNLVETPARQLLERLGWTYVPRTELSAERDGERQVLLTGRLAAALRRLNPGLTENEAQRVIFNLQHVSETGLARNRAIHEYLTYGMPLIVQRDGRQETPTVRFFNFDATDPDAGRNEYVVTTQFRVRRGNERPDSAAGEDDGRLVIPDLVLFVNGIPLVVMEAKAPTLMDVWKSQAVEQLRRYQEAEPKWHGAGAPELFDYNLACVVLGGGDAGCATLGAPLTAYAGWNSLHPYTEADFEQELGVPPEGQAKLFAGLLNPATLLDILRDYVVFENERGRLVKKLPRHQQYRAVRQAVERATTGRAGKERGGVVWHTQGSGKSLTMLWLATKLRRTPSLDNPTIVVVTDRTQLDRQITATFHRASALTPERAGTTAQLRQLLMSGNGRTVMTTIQKFEEALGETTDKVAPLNDAHNLFVMVDEAHRTQYGRLAAKMRAALPNAAFIGFTGTPIDRNFRRSTLGVFGGLIDSYTIAQSVEDRATVPIRYEARLPDLHIDGPNTLDSIFDALFGDEPEATRQEIQRRYANKETIAEAAQRIQSIALDISQHFKAKIQPNGFKAQVVASSRAAAMRYAQHLNEFGVSTYPIITTTPSDGQEFQLARELNEAEITAQFIDPTGEAQILVVVDKLITGFDAPVEQALYLDRSIREHTLLQAIARVNRRFSHVHNGVATEKEHGLIVDYHGVSRELDKALSIFRKDDTAAALTALPEDPAPVIEAAANRAEAHFRSADLDDVWGCVHVFDADANTDGDFKIDAYDLFDHDYRQFSRLMDRFLPDPSALNYVDRLKQLTVIRSYARATFLRERADIDWTAIGAKVKQLLDSRISAEVRNLMAPVSILDKDFEQKIKTLPHDEARASVMEHGLKARIKEGIAENPVSYERLSDALNRIISDLRAQVIDAAEASRRMAELQALISNEVATAQSQGMSRFGLAVFQLLEQGAPTDMDAHKGQASVAEPKSAYATSSGAELKEWADHIENIIDEHRVFMNWREDLEVQRTLRRDIKRMLRDTNRYMESELDIVTGQMVEMARIHFP